MRRATARLLVAHPLIHAKSGIGPFFAAAATARFSGAQKLPANSCAGGELREKRRAQATIQDSLALLAALARNTQQRLFIDFQWRLLARGALDISCLARCRRVALD